LESVAKIGVYCATSDKSSTLIFAPYELCESY